MEWTKLHGQVLGPAFEKVLGRAEGGAMAFVRCLTPDVVERLAKDDNFSLKNWRILRVADADDADRRTITADRAVEIRETKGEATLLLVDTHLAGAGMDGIYSASREVDEASLFEEARRRVAAECDAPIVEGKSPLCRAGHQKGAGIRRSVQRFALDRI